MINNPLVSIITTCYNGEAYLHRYFKSILDQTYEHIELIFVNNGSTDRTQDVCDLYKSRIIERKIKYQYISLKTNQYISGGIQAGLKAFNGDFFFCPDSDDLLYPDNIKLKVEYLINNPQFALLTSYSRVVKEDELEKSVGYLKRIPPKGKDTAFLDTILARNVVFTGVGYLFRKDAFLRINPKREIFISPYGQNYQILLPFFYHYNCGYLEEVTSDYVIRKDNYSNSLKGIRQIEAFNGQEETIKETLNFIKPNNIDFYLELSHFRFNRERFLYACKMKNPNLIKKYFDIYSKENKAKIIDYFYYLSSICAPFNILLLFLRKKRRKTETNLV